jgi:hypothetical protein
VAAVEPLDDEDEGRLAVSEPEMEVYAALQEVRFAVHASVASAMKADRR